MKMPLPLLLLLLLPPPPLPPPPPWSTQRMLLTGVIRYYKLL